MKYTAVCIGGESDGRIISSDLRTVHIPILEPIEPAIAVDAPVRQSRDETFYAHRLQPDDGKPIIVLVHSDMSLRQGLEALLDVYAGVQHPKNSPRKAEPSEVDVLTARIRTLEELCRGSQQIIRDLRARLGE